MFKGILTSVYEGLGLAHWLIVKTANPACQYYFGPFLSEEEAQAHRAGYIADLEAEGARGIAVEIKKCRKPPSLTLEAAEVER
jgi:hypothetical protein